MPRFQASISLHYVTVLDTEEDVEIEIPVDDIQHPVVDGIDLDGDPDSIRAEATENLYEILAANLRERGYSVRPGDLFVNTDRIEVFLPQGEQC
jgi:hypothetical protein